ncbi:carboxy terminal-processing peptidase [Litoribrevibacter euphylliae]|uniref:Carboxy terminal-processing peptidase n=1 Tax=Litoribrevibacter euphylliae TaxID=1834034 RepID=A0ABV7HBY3_9GAMM
MTMTFRNRFIQVLLIAAFSAISLASLSALNKDDSDSKAPNQLTDDQIPESTTLASVESTSSSNTVARTTSKELTNDLNTDTQDIASDELSLLTPDIVHPGTNREIVLSLLKGHYSSPTIDDNLSKKMFDSYLQSLDPNKLYFTAADIQSFSQNSLSLDNALLTNNLKPAFEIFNSYQQKLVERMEWVLAQLNDESYQWNFEQNDQLLIDRSEAPWETSQEALNTLWDKRIKNAMLGLVLAGKEQDEAKETLIKRYKNQLNRAKQTKSEDVFELYMNAFTMTFDPHTNYLSPRDAENFDINMRLSLQGIGAVLQSDNEYTKVVRLIAAGPADKAGELKPGDRIVGVGQDEDGEMVDVIGERLDDVVKKIRGKRDTLVRLEIIPASSTDITQTKIIKIVRDKVKLEEQSAQKDIIEITRNGQTHKIGVINIPTFYMDFEAFRKRDPNYKSTSRDVKNLIAELQAEDIDGLVVDLRNNGGGSLFEARELTGLFIRQGPTVQVRDIDQNVQVHTNSDSNVYYDGPMAVLVNRLSASASEIFAGAMQDYQRAIVLGGQTFGKGTVQSLQRLNHGEIKLTQAKFYRISGKSTQNMGVIPDIEFPSLYNKDVVGESSLDNALPWDTISSVHHSRYGNFSPLMPSLESNHQARIEHNPDFQYLNKQIQRLNEQRNKEYISLNMTTRKSERESMEEASLVLENERRKAKGEEPFESVEAMNEFNSEQDAEKKPAQEDAILVESGEILLDMVSLASKDNLQVTLQ